MEESEITVDNDVVSYLSQYGTVTEHGDGYYVTNTESTDKGENYKIWFPKDTSKWGKMLGSMPGADGESDRKTVYSLLDDGTISDCVVAFPTASSYTGSGWNRTGVDENGDGVQKTFTTATKIIEGYGVEVKDFSLQSFSLTTSKSVTFQIMNDYVKKNPDVNVSMIITDPVDRLDPSKCDFPELYDIPIVVANYSGSGHAEGLTKKGYTNVYHLQTQISGHLTKSDATYNEAIYAYLLGLDTDSDKEKSDKITLYRCELDENGKVVKTEVSYDELKELNLCNANVYNTVETLYMHSSYKQTSDMINEINKGVRGYEINKYIPQVKSSLGSSTLTTGSNNVFTDYEICNINFVQGISEGLNSIASTMQVIQDMDQSLAADVGLLGVLYGYAGTISVSKTSFADYQGSVKLDRYFDIGSKTCINVSSSDITNIKKEFEDLISSDNSYLNSLKTANENLKECSNNYGQFWNAISGVLDGYNDAISEKTSFNSKKLTEVNDVLDEIQSALHESGHDPVTYEKREAINNTLTKCKERLVVLKANLFSWETDSKGFVHRVKNEGIALQIEIVNQQIDFWTEELNEIDTAIEKIRQAEIKLNSIFYEFQKYNAYLAESIPRFGTLSLEKTGRDYINESTATTQNA